MNAINYQNELDKIIKDIETQKVNEDENKNKKLPTLLLHSCCAPCSSYVLEYLSKYFKITVLFYNPNITPEEEYEKRRLELKRLISEIEVENEILVMESFYNPKDFFDISKGLETAKEGGERCFKCFELRLRETAKLAAKGGFDYFTTTLTISPLKNAKKINEIGEKLELEYSVKHLPSDFKKREGYKRSIILSQKHNLYRQNYCGCVFSKP
ncbi:MAG: epoxyqueuosine reductase QueH [Oscillospiraceae bacterium]